MRTLVQIESTFLAAQQQYANLVLERLQRQSNGQPVSETLNTRIDASFILIDNITYLIAVTPTDLAHINEQLNKLIAFVGAPLPTLGALYDSSVNPTQFIPIVVGNAPLATNLVHGLVRLSVAAANGADPIAVGDNDPRLVNAGTVTSVGIVAPDIFTVSGSPVITAGDITLALATQSANTVFRGPTTGSPAVPTFGALVVADLPSAIPATKIGNGTVDNTEFSYLNGVTSAIQTQLDNKQPLDATLTALAAYNTNGFLVQTATDTFAGRSLIAGTGVSISNGNGVAGNPTISMDTSPLLDLFIQNTTIQQTSANFNIDGDGVIGNDLTVTNQLNLLGVAELVDEYNILTIDTLGLVEYITLSSLIVDLGGEFIQNQTAADQSASSRISGVHLVRKLTEADAFRLYTTNAGDDFNLVNIYSSAASVALKGMVDVARVGGDVRVQLDGENGIILDEDDFARVTTYVTTWDDTAKSLRMRTNTDFISDLGLAVAGSISGTMNFVAVFTSASTIGNSSIFDSGSSIGIKTTTPDIFSRGYDGTILGISTPSGASAIELNSATGNTVYFDMGVNGAKLMGLEVSASGDTAIGCVNAGEFYIYTTATRRLTIAPGGDATFANQVFIPSLTADDSSYLGVVTAESATGQLKYRTLANLITDFGGAFILNQNVSAQSTSNYWISGRGTATEFRTLNGANDSVFVSGTQGIFYGGTDVDNEALPINDVGYQGGITRYRDVLIGDGKGNGIARFIGDVSNSVEIYGNLDVDIQTTTGSLVVGTIALINTSLSVGATGVHIVADEDIFLYGEDIDNDALHINRIGYGQSTTRFRNTVIGNGKNGIIAEFIGAATNSVAINGDVAVDGNISISLGNGLFVDEGADATMGRVTLSGGTIVVNTTKVTANSRIFLTIQGGTLTNVGEVYISARTASTSFTISSTNASDASDVAWLIVEPV